MHDMLFTDSVRLEPEQMLQRAGVQPGWQLADFGCGAFGQFVFPAALAVGGAGRVYAVDVQKLLLHAIRRRARAGQAWNVHPVWSDVERFGATPIPAHSLDLIIMAQLLSCLQEPVQALREAERLVKPGGHILIIEWRKEPTLLGPEIERRMHAEDLQALLGETQWHPSEHFYPSNDHQAMICLNHKLPAVQVDSHSPAW